MVLFVKQNLTLIKQIVLSVLVERIARFAVDQYVMPHVEKLPTHRRKPFGFK